MTFLVLFLMLNVLCCQADQDVGGIVAVASFGGFGAKLCILTANGELHCAAVVGVIKGEVATDGRCVGAIDILKPAVVAQNITRA